MAKVVVTLNDQVQHEVALLKSRLTVGRRPGNDLVLDHLTVSGQHAAIDTAPSGTFILDLGSTNGTLVNGQPITKHLLQNEDVIDIGKYKLRFFVDSIKPVETNIPNIVKNAVTKTPLKIERAEEVTIAAKIKVLNGDSAGKELTLSKSVTKLGSPGVIVVAITRESKYYSILTIEGKVFPKVNNIALDSCPQQLHHGDVIELSGVRMQFFSL